MNNYFIINTLLCRIAIVVDKLLNHAEVHVHTADCQAPPRISYRYIYILVDKLLNHAEVHVPTADCQAPPRISYMYTCSMHSDVGINVSTVFQNEIYCFTQL